MATNHTANYGLHVWEPEDDFSREEINENFGALDSKAVQMVFGSYTGNGQGSQFISLGFTPRAVLVIPRDGRAGSYSLALTVPTENAAQSNGTPLLEATDGGFRAYYSSTSSSNAVTTNAQGRAHHFWAIP